jgi:hypothetical protein
MVYLIKKKFLVGTYNKLKPTKIGPCRILRRFYENAYEVELLDEIGISPIFNVEKLYLFKELDSGITDEPIGEENQIEWEEKLPKKTQRGIEKVLDKRMTKKTRGKEYFQYLVKWKGHPTEDSNWIKTTKVHKYHVDPKDMINSSFLP